MPKLGNYWRTRQKAPIRTNQPLICRRKAIASSMPWLICPGKLASKLIRLPETSLEYATYTFGIELA